MTSDYTNGDFSIAQLVTQMKVNALKDREVFLWGEIDENEELVVNRWLEKIVKNDLSRGLPKKPIRINISSPGGSVFSGLSIVSEIELLREAGYEIQTYSYGICMSAALFVFMTGSKRFAQRHTRFMLHQPLMNNFPGYSSVETTKRMYKDLDEIWVRYKELAQKYTLMKEADLDQIASNDQDFYFFPETAKELGFVDVIL